MRSGCITTTAGPVTGGSRLATTQRWRGNTQGIAAARCLALKGCKAIDDAPIVAVFADHQAAEAAVKKLAAAGFEMKNLSVVGKGYHTDEKVVGFYNTGDRVKFWGTRGAFWGGFWGLFFGGLFMTIPVVGHVVVLGYLAAMVVSGLETAVVVGGLSALGAALYSIGIPKDSVIQYETAVKADDFLVMAHGRRRKWRAPRRYSVPPSRHVLMCIPASRRPRTTDQLAHAGA